MKCLQLHSSLLPIHLHQKLLKPQQNYTVQTTKLLWGEPCRTLPHRQQHFFPFRTKALPHFIVVAATVPPNSNDLAAFLPVSALLISVYFIANFVVPDILTKYSGYDQLNEDQKVDDVEEE
ncbi:uncharacterized protein LOC130731520 [Lotus japonicus]|uniref:uncharacterized protein LOC130731520 n=1 Tax=Lotus japonicus TaxID=34305 RepID=UPI00258280CB|nr:uncharacterized protein LOC130731520 [Lotus japonicus]